MAAKKQPVELVTYLEIEALTGVSQNLLRQWSYRGKLPEPDFRIGRSPAWYKSTIDDWNFARKVKIEGE
jgi:predicted DNA-binding transcriptional regulator AlpA